MSSPAKRPLIEEVADNKETGADATSGHDDPSVVSSKGQPPVAPEKESAAASAAAASETRKGAGSSPKRAEFLEVGVTARPQGHSLDLRPGGAKPFTAPMPPSALLAKLDQFLPQIAKANEELARNPAAASALEISRVDDADEGEDDLDRRGEGGDDDNGKDADGERGASTSQGCNANVKAQDSALSNMEADDDDDEGEEEQERGVTMNITLVPLGEDGEVQKNGQAGRAGVQEDDAVESK
ncbi:Hypothetical Protein FCC1311_096052 [Hondaea fermentalgiana]|uniref:Uncharacterized protein n=1 Tax=Hondaea fermentalgiana TaxID=2315210 RepID=A0A2R5GR80_9STRA|nr:Hypothetical Protein FCC1311_096052 [Hondaea fermentalgiana]|eukprot:GBG33382.1 Hypothetical Protein FCC1311_096052 [Hondaea fermentalgiana]